MAMTVMLRSKPIRFQPILSLKMRAVARRTLSILTSGSALSTTGRPARRQGAFSRQSSSIRTEDAARDQQETPARAAGGGARTWQTRIMLNRWALDMPAAGSTPPEREVKPAAGFTTG